MNWSEWCKKNRDALQGNRERVLLVHPEHGILMSEPALKNFGKALQALDARATAVIKRSIKKECCYLDVELSLRDLDCHTVAVPSKKKDKEAAEGLKGWTKKRKKGEPKNVPQMSPSVDPFDNEELNKIVKQMEPGLQETIKKFGTTAVQAAKVATKTGEEYWTGKPKHKQPDFQPVPFDPYDSDMVIDSAGKMGQRLRPPGRGGTYD